MEKDLMNYISFITLSAERSQVNKLLSLRTFGISRICLLTQLLVFSLLLHNRVTLYHHLDFLNYFMSLSLNISIESYWLY